MMLYFILFPCLLVLNLQLLAAATCTLHSPEYKFSYSDELTKITCTCTGKNVSEHDFLNWKTNVDTIAVFHERNETVVSSTLLITPNLQHGLDQLILKLHCAAFNATSLQSVLTTLIVCPSEQLQCNLLQSSPTALYNISCRYCKSKCGTALRCEVGNKLLLNPQQVANNSAEESTVMYMYSDVDLKEEPVKCYLHHPKMDEVHRTEILLTPVVKSKTTKKTVLSSLLLTTPYPSMNSNSKESGSGKFIIIGVVCLVIGIIIVVGPFILCMKKNAKFRTWFIERWGMPETSGQTPGSGPSDEALMETSQLNGTA